MGSPPPDVRRIRRWRRTLGVVTVVAWVLFSLLAIVDLTVLKTAWWMDGMDNADTYDRVYTEVLADPGMETFVADLLGGWPVDPSLVTGNLRTLVPPAAVRRTIETVLDEFTAYLEGAKDDVDSTVALEPLWTSIERVLDANVATAIRSLPSLQAADAEQFRVNLVDFIAKVASGEKPDFLPTIPLDESTTATVTEVLLGPLDAPTRASIEPDLRVALAQGDLNTAMTLVGHHYAKPLLDSSIVRLKERTGGDRLDLSVSLSSMRDEPAVRTIGRVRTIWSDILQPLGILLGVLAIGASVGSAFLARREGIDWWRWIATLLMATGAIALAVWALLRLLFGDPFDSIWADPSVPYGLASVIRDAGRNLVTSADWVAVRATLLPAVIGTLIAVAALVPRLVPSIRERPTPTRRILEGGLIAVIVLAAAVLVVAIWPRPEKLRGEVCNGRADLCQLRLDEVVLAGSHNSEAAADAEFLGPNQDWTMPVQMQVGVRALLLKSMYWESPTMADDFLATLSPNTSSTLRALIGAALPRRPGTWMCHNLCALGATPLVEGFRWIREFVEDHPDEVLVVIIGDSVSPADTLAVADEAGLTPMIYTPDDDPNAPWPTLERMILDGRNVVVFSEHNDVPGTWYRNFFRYAMETPFQVAPGESFSCDPNRGGDDKHLFLMNNWVTAAMASRLDAGPTNDPVFVEHRAKACAEERGRRVNIVAANFVDVPDVFMAVDGLNNLAVLDHDARSTGPG